MVPPPEPPGFLTVVGGVGLAVVPGVPLGSSLGVGVGLPLGSTLGVGSPLGVGVEVGRGVLVGLGMSLGFGVTLGSGLGSLLVMVVFPSFVLSRTSNPESSTDSLPTFNSLAVYW